MRRLLVLSLLVAGTGCESTSRPDTVDVDPGPLRVIPVTSTRLDHPLLILVNTATKLFRVDPVSLDLTELGTFTYPGPEGEPKYGMTDIAMDRKGRLWGVGFDAVFRIDARTLECTRLATLPSHQLNALAIMTSTMVPGREVPDVMLAAEANTDVVYQVDPDTGAVTEVGNLGGALKSSGDVTWAPGGVGAVMITTDFAGYEGISAIDPGTFKATPIGTGWAFQKVRGLSMLPHGRLLGVTEQGEMIEIDPATGDARLRKVHPQVFYGAAVGWQDTIATP